eukprot:5142150-Pleurochrysis_carterae.AAC.2
MAVRVDGSVWYRSTISQHLLFSVRVALGLGDRFKGSAHFSAILIFVGARRRIWIWHVPNPRSSLSQGQGKR